MCNLLIKKKKLWFFEWIFTCLFHALVNWLHSFARTCKISDFCIFNRFLCKKVEGTWINILVSSEIARTLNQILWASGCVGIMERNTQIIITLLPGNIFPIFTQTLVDNMQLLTFNKVNSWLHRLDYRRYWLTKAVSGECSGLPTILLV